MLSVALGGSVSVVSVEGVATEGGERARLMILAPGGGGLGGSAGGRWLWLRVLVGWGRGGWSDKRGGCGGSGLGLRWCSGGGGVVLGPPAEGARGGMLLGNVHRVLPVLVLEMFPHVLGSWEELGQPCTGHGT